MAADAVAKLSALLPASTPAPVPLARRKRIVLPPAKPLKRQAAPPAPEKNKKSIAAQIGGVFAGLPSGVVHMVKEAAVDTAGFVRAPVESFQHRGESHLGVGPDGRPQFLGGPHITDEKYFPLLTGFGHGMEDTSGRLAQLGPVEVRSVGGRKVHTYGDLARNGEIVPALLGDALNVSLAAGAAGGALGGAARAADAAGLTRTAAVLDSASDVAGTTARLGGRAANAPLEVSGTVLKGGRSLWREAGTRLENRLRESLPAESAAGTRFVRSLTDDGRLLHKAAVDTRVQPGALGTWVRTNFGKDAGALDGPNAPSLVEQEVGLSRAVGVSQADKMVSDVIGPAESMQAHVGPVNMQIPGQTMTTDGQALGHAYENGTLPPDQMARIDRVTHAYNKWIDQQTERAMAGRGQKALDPRHVGDQPFDEQVVRQLENAKVPDADIAALSSLVAAGHQWKDLIPLEPALDQILVLPDVYPSPWRDAMNVFGQGAKAADDAGIPHAFPRTPEEILAAGIERPKYMSGAIFDPNAPRSEGTVATSEGFKGIKDISSENHKLTLGHGQYSLSRAAAALQRGASDTEYNHILTKYVQNAALKGPLDVLSVPTKTKAGELPPVDWADLHDEAVRRVDAQDLGGMTAAEKAHKVAVLRGEAVYGELQARGYDVLNGNKLDPKPGDFDPSQSYIDFKNIDPDTTLVIPAGLKARLRVHETGTKTNMALGVTSRWNAFFKRNVLPLNAHWTIGDGISNLLTSWVSGKISPDEMFAAGRKISNLDPVLADELFNRPQLMKSGLKMQVAKELNPTLAERPAPKFGFRTIRKAQDAGFAFNEFTNRVQRHQYVYAKLDKELRARGLSDGIEGIGAGSAKWKDPPVQRAINDVVNDANKTLGTWDEMSPFEQRFATQVFPFWSWIRHINSLVLRTAIDNPARVLWTLRLGAMGAAMDPADLPPFLRGGVNTPFGRLNLNWTNPFYDVGSGALLSPDTALRSVSPAIKAGTTLLTGRSMDRNLNTITHRPGQKLGFGDNVRAAAYGVLTSSPFGRGALNLAPTGEIPGLQIGTGPHRRYGSGQNIMVPGTDTTADTQFGTDVSTGQQATVRNDSRLRAAGNVFNLPMPQHSVIPIDNAGRRKRRTGLRRTGLGNGGLKRTGLGSG